MNEDSNNEDSKCHKLVKASLGGLYLQCKFFYLLTLVVSLFLVARLFTLLPGCSVEGEFG